MGSFRLVRPLIIEGNDVDTLEDAAYAVRQLVIKDYDPDGSKIVRGLRDAASHSEAERAEKSLQAWLAKKSSVFRVGSK